MVKESELPVLHACYVLIDANRGKFITYYSRGMCLGTPLVGEGNYFVKPLI